jgi:hypothetical protein
MPPPATNTEPTTPFPERAFSAHICNTPVKAKFWLKVLGYDYQGVIQTHLKIKNASLLHDHQQSDPQNNGACSIRPIELRNERKDLMAMDLTTGSHTTVWQYFDVGMQETCLALSA